MRIYHEIQDDRLLALAAGVVFYSLLALFPALAAGVRPMGCSPTPPPSAKHLSLVADIVPAGTPRHAARADQAHRRQERRQAHASAFCSGLGIALWSANAGMKAIFDALNVIYEEEEKRGFIWLNLVSLIFTICAIAAALLAIGAVVVFPLVSPRFGLSSFDEPIIGYLRWPVLFVLMHRRAGGALSLRPEPAPAKWRWLSVGSVFAALAWLAVSSLFSWYLANFANYNATYGSLGAVIGLMMWMWLSTIVVLVGAELNSEIEHQTARDTTVGPEKPLGARGAAMADTVGASRHLRRSRVGAREHHPEKWEPVFRKRSCCATISHWLSGRRLRETSCGPGCGRDLPRCGSPNSRRRRASRSWRLRCNG